MTWRENNCRCADSAKVVHLCNAPGKESDKKKSAGAVSEGEKVFSFAESSFVQTRGGDQSHRHHILRTLDSETGFTSCASIKRGPRPGPVNPHRNRASAHEISPYRDRWSLVRLLDRRPQARGAPMPIARPRWSLKTERAAEYQTKQVRRCVPLRSHRICEAQELFLLRSGMFQIPGRVAAR